MPISTRTGDDGLTTWRNVRVSKNSKEIEFIGFLDVAMADVAAARVEAREAASNADEVLAKVSGMLSDIAAIAAADANRDLLLALTYCDKYTRGFELTSFVDFGLSNRLAASINRARASVRLVESHFIDACDEQNPLVRLLLNRVSDVLFVLAVQCSNA